MVSVRTVFGKLNIKNKKLYIHNRKISGISKARRLALNDTPEEDIIYICSEEEYMNLPGGHSGNYIILLDEIAKFSCDNNRTDNVIILDSKKTESRILELVNNIIAGNDFGSKSEEDVVMADFLDIACQGNLQKFLFAVYEVWGNPVIVHDTSFRLMYSEWGLSDKETINAGYKHVGYLGDQSIKFLHDNNIMAYAAEKKAPFLLDSPIGQKVLFIPILKSGLVIAVLLILEVNTIFTREDLPLAEKIGKIFTLSIQNNKEFLYPLGMAHDQFFKELVAGSYTDPETVTLRINLFNITLGTNHRVGVAASNNKKLSRDSLSILVSELENILDVKMCLLYKDKIVFLLSDNGHCILSDYQHMRLSNFLDANGLLCVLSHDFSNIFFTRQHYLQALNLFDHVCRQNDPAVINYFEDNAFRVLIQSAEITTAKRELVHPVIELIMANDEQYGLDLLNTLKVYVFNLKHINSTAQALGIHRNTLFYRLKCLKEQFDINLDDAKTIFELMFSFYVLEEIEKDRNTIK